MKDLLIGLGLLCCPAIIFAVFGVSGLAAFDDGGFRAEAVSAEVDGLAFARECGGCHGRAAQGTARGPALATTSYGRSRFDDDSIRSAVREGRVPRSPDSAGMPASPEIPESDLAQILDFLREVQRARGIQ